MTAVAQWLVCFVTSVSSLFNACDGVILLASNMHDSSGLQVANATLHRPKQACGHVRMESVRMLC